MPVYIRLFHGRTSPQEVLDDWGADGPSIGPLDYVHGTYMCDLKFGGPVAVFEKFFPDFVADYRKNGYYVGTNFDHHFKITDDLIAHGGMYYGDWSVTSEPA